jgi:uncharacterized protein with HEPN domain
LGNDNRDLYILGKIIQYCLEANETIARFGDTFETLKNDNIFKNAAAMCIIQIGELAGHLSEKTTEKYPKMPWKQIRGMRNIAAHGYEGFDIDILWQTLKTDLPTLNDYCKEIIEAENVK